MKMARIAPAPRALSGRIRADADPARLIGEIRTAVLDMRADSDRRFSALEEVHNAAALQGAAALMGGSGDGQAVDPEYRRTFASYARRGAPDAEATLKAANATGERASIQAAMSEGDTSSGGYLAPVEWDRKVQKAQRALSPMRRLAQVVTTGRAAYSTLWSNDQFGSGWVGETATRPATTTATFTPLVIPAGEIYAMPAATQRLLDDSAINLEEWLGTNLADEFSRQEGIAFVGGNGLEKPMGFLQYAPGNLAEAAHPGGALSVTPSGSADAVANADALIDLKYGLAAPYRQNATWVMNSSTAAVIAKLKDGQGGYIWREALLASEPATLLGRPVEIDENMPNIAAAVDGKAALPIAFGDFQKGYIINDRVGVRILRDPYTNKPFVMFYATKRVGGGLLDPRAIRLLKIATN
ncbi:phage major capsid protein [Sphingomonas endolithica]|uniref:phage major capsid protein n=1 Tax=Sphingomonas endolithica TaxID=2972485 RepID=UPI0021AE90A8|nr:phage major capsid protein [Sphingomonas sp. ZFBP2030]